VAYSTTVPAPHPLAEIEPDTEGHTLLAIKSVGRSGVVQVAGAVATAVDIGLITVASLSQMHRVTML
jgi:hypothetical protein